MIEDHPIFLESIRFISSKLSHNKFNDQERTVLERLIHTSGDFSIQNLLVFSENACEIGIKAIQNKAPILTDTDMAAASIKSMAKRVGVNQIFTASQWFDSQKDFSTTKTAFGIEQGWYEISKNNFGERSPIVVFGSSPTALEKLLDILEKDKHKPSLIIGMPVGFIGVEQSKKRLINSGQSYIVVGSTRGGAAMAGATINALLRSTI
tara:strand:+ start:564 stop:1187 length:624 start_codon:yes stop_codon:yes gene_type:complete